MSEETKIEGAVDMGGMMAPGVICGLKLQTKVCTREQRPGEWYAWIDAYPLIDTTARGATEAEAVCALAATLAEGWRHTMSRTFDLKHRVLELEKQIAEMRRPKARESKEPKPGALERMQAEHRSPGDRLPGTVELENMTSACDFGAVVLALKKGKRAARTGWNGKGMWLALVPGDAWTITNGAIPAIALGAILHDTNRFLPWIGMRTADRGFVPWLASQTDVLAADWQIFD